MIESCSVNGPSATIKSHHNVGGLPEHMNLKIVEPLRLLFKDEVRRVGRSLGIDPLILGPPSVPRTGAGYPYPGRSDTRKGGRVAGGGQNLYRRAAPLGPLRQGVARRATQLS